MLTNLTSKIDQMDNRLQHLETQPRVLGRPPSRPSSEPIPRKNHEDMPRAHTPKNYSRKDHQTQPI